MMENIPVVFTITKIANDHYVMVTNDFRCSDEPSPRIKAEQLFSIMSDLTSSFNEKGVGVLFEVE